MYADYATVLAHPESVLKLEVCLISKMYVYQAMLTGHVLGHICET